MNRDVHVDQVCGDDALLQLYAEGTLDPHEASAVKRHIAACRPCRVAVAEYKQIMWDLQRLPEIELPPELDTMYGELMQAWKQERQSSPVKSRPLVPAWAAYSVLWTRNLFPVGAALSLMRQIHNSLTRRTLSRWLRRKGGERD
ncbi:MAG TPA: zf-HC2 domain-containing protein [Limnochordia bacterium]|nr:zf-HC2 domain-containing protein [Limnochordia bacterium]